LAIAKVTECKNLRGEATAFTTQGVPAAQGDLALGGEKKRCSEGNGKELQRFMWEEKEH